MDLEYYLLRVDSTDTPYKPYDPDQDQGSHRILIESGGKLVDLIEVSPTIKVFTQSAYSLTRVVFPAESGGMDIRSRIERVFGVGVG